MPSSGHSFGTFPSHTLLLHLLNALCCSSGHIIIIIDYATLEEADASMPLPFLAED